MNYQIVPPVKRNVSVTLLKRLCSSAIQLHILIQIQFPEDVE